ncbi:MAG: transferrin-binding protein-like solute binding protein [Rhizobiaceae bacterium]|nr:transferrin-binding protein-like solute binding protein [Rhizobiaceae bacterium]
MNRIVMLGVAGAVVGASGCGPAVGPGGGFTQVDKLYTRSMAMQINGAGEATGVVDRSNAEQTMTITQTGSGVSRQADVTVSGSMIGGTTVPGDDGMPVDPTSLVDYIPTFQNSDSFLGELIEGNNYATVKYETDLGNRRFVSYGVTEGRETASMPNSGTATYNGHVNGTVYGSQTGEQALSGNVSLGANFGPGVATIGGKMSNLRLIQGSDNFALGSDIVVNAAPVSGNSYGNPAAALQFVFPGTNVSSATMASSSLDGAFYGGTAQETAGTFQFNAIGAPISTGGTENIQGVGAFGAAR